MKLFFKSKSRIINVEKEIKYKDTTSQYIRLKSKKDIDEKEKDLKKDLENYNNDILRSLQIRAGIDNEELLNKNRIIKLYYERKEKAFFEGIRTSDGTVTTDPLKIRSEIRNLCVDLFSPIIIENSVIKKFLYYECQNDRYSKELENKIEEREVIKAISQLNVKKSPGKDGLPADSFQLSAPVIAGVLTKVYSEGLEKGGKFESFYEGVLSLLYKKGDVLDINNGRHLTLMNVDYQIFASV